jgi:hypothetical protein
MLSAAAMHVSPDSAVVSDAIPSPQTFVVPPDGGQTLHAYGDTAQTKLNGTQTNGSMVVALPEND